MKAVEMKEKLLLLHGALGIKNQFNELKSILHQDFIVYDMNFEGHGGLVSVNEFSIELFTQNVLDYLKEKDLNKIHVFGYSMGGYVALNLAINYPGVITKIVTLGTKFDWTPEGAEKEVKMLNPDVIELKVPKFAIQLATNHSADNWKKVMKNTADMMYGLGNGKKIANEKFKQIHHNVLICIGGNDTMVSVEESEEVVEVLQNGKLKVIEGFQHPIDKVDKQALASIIHNFIKG